MTLGSERRKDEKRKKEEQRRIDFQFSLRRPS